MTQNNLTSGNVSTIKGSYEIDSASSTGYVVGAAYAIPEIALRAEVLYQPKSKITTKTNYDATGGVYNAAAVLVNGEKETLNVQSGIAENTLMFASYHRSKWSGAPVVVDIEPAMGGAVDPKIDETFDDSEKFTIGIGRKFSDKLSGSLSYSKEDGGGDTAESLFTFSNGTETISAGLRYTIDNMDISVGVSRSTLGDVTVDGGAGDIVYEGNSVTAMGVKIAFAF